MPQHHRQTGRTASSTAFGINPNRWLLLSAGIALIAFATSFVSPSIAQNSATSGQFQVTDAGAATYGIPLYSAPSSGGLDVKLSLQYSSQSPNGVLGVGWSLTGVSAITRCPKTPAEEGERIGVKNDASDVFCLDGQKLRAVSGSYGLANSEYRTAIDSYSKIIANGSQGSGPQSFTVYTKSGAILEFGGTPDSRLEHPGKANTVRVWMVNQMRDRFSTAANSNATAINFSYAKNTTLGEQLLQTVRHNNGQIKLIYEARPAIDQILKYDDGIQLGSTQSRVSKIEIYDEPVVNSARQLRLFKQYNLAYIQSQATQRSLITSIQECTVGNVCLPSIGIQYQSELPVAAFVQDRVIAGGVSFLIDSDADGRLEPVSYLQIMQRYGFSFENSSLGPLSRWDFDGNGKTDFFVVDANVGSDSDNRIGYLLYDSGQAMAESLSPQAGEIICFADFLGTGESNYVKLKVDTGFEPALLLLQSNLHPLGTAVAHVGNLIDKNCHVVDTNGDGRAEIVFNGSVFFHGSQSLIISALSFPRNISEYGIPSLEVFPAGDFNGDGKTDHISDERQNGIKINYSRGLATNWVSSIAFQGASVNEATIGCAADFNGDGRTDLLVNRVNQSPSLLLSIGTTFVEMPSGLPVLTGIVPCGDVNGDGNADVVGNGTQVGVTLFNSAFAGATDRLIQVNNGLGYIHKVEYKSITDNSVYTKSSGAVRPQVDVQTPVQVVSRVQSGNGTQGWNATSYRYEGLRADLHRRGTQGFAKVISRNEATDISVATTYLQDHPFTGMKSVVHKYRGSATSPQTLESSNYTYDRRGYNGAAANAQFSQVHLIQSETSQTDLSGAFLGREQEFIEQIDSFGNPQQIRSILLDASGNPTSRKITQLAYSNNANNWLIGLPTSNSTRQENLRSLPTTTAGNTQHANSQSLYNSFALSLAPSTLTASRNTPGILTASASASSSGADAPYSYSWSKLSGNRISISNANSATPSFSATVSLGDNFTETVRVTATDAAGRVSSRDLSINFSTPAALNIGTNPAATLVASRSNPGVLTANASASASGGVARYSYSWSKISGSRISIGSANSANAGFSANVGWGENFTEQVQVVVTDAAGNLTPRVLSVNFQSSALTPVGASASVLSVTNSCGNMQATTRINVSGGAPPYSYSWSVPANEDGFPLVAVTPWGSGLNHADFVLSYLQTGYATSVRVNDSSGQQTYAYPALPSGGNDCGGN